MTRLSLLPLALALATASGGGAGIETATKFFTIRLTLPEGKSRVQYVRVTDGRLALTNRGGWSDWWDRANPRPDRWYVLGTKIKSSVGGGYLAYDPSGKDPRVFLSRTAGEGTTWTIGDPGGGRFDIYGVAQPASGKVKGWHLDVEEFKQKRKDGRAVSAYRLVLRKDDPRTRVRVTRVYSYRPTAR
jgi:hypothetical protein